MWPCIYSLRGFFVFCPQFVVLLLCLVDPVWNCDNLVCEEREGGFAFL